MFRKKCLVFLLLVVLTLLISCSTTVEEIKDSPPVEGDEPLEIKKEKEDAKNQGTEKIKNSEDATSITYASAVGNPNLVGDREIEPKISLRRAPLIGDSNDMFKFRVVLQSQELSNLQLQLLQNGIVYDSYPFYNDGEHNDQLMNDNVHVAWVDSLPVGEYSTRLNYMSNGKEVTDRISSPFVVIDPIDAACESVVDTGGEINIVFAFVDYAGDSTQLVEKIFDYEGMQDGILSDEPFTSNRDQFNAWVVDEEISLSDYPLLEGAVAGEFLKKGYGLFTACELENQYNVLVYNDPGKRVGIAALSYAQVSPTADMSLPLDDTDVRNVIGVVVHEFGHAFADLTDEYIGHGLIAESPDQEQCFFSEYVECFASDEGGEACRQTEESREDCLLNSPWASLIGEGEGNVEIGCYLGCGARRNLYRSTLNSIMNTDYSGKFGLVNEKDICEVIERLTGDSAGVCDSY